MLTYLSWPRARSTLLKEPNRRHANTSHKLLFPLAVRMDILHAKCVLALSQDVGNRRKTSQPSAIYQPPSRTDSKSRTANYCLLSDTGGILNGTFFLTLWKWRPLCPQYGCYSFVEPRLFEVPTQILGSRQQNNIYLTPKGCRPIIILYHGVCILVVWFVTNLELVMCDGNCRTDGLDEWSMVVTSTSSAELLVGSQSMTNTPIVSCFWRSPSLDLMFRALPDLSGYFKLHTKPSLDSFSEPYPVSWDTQASHEARWIHFPAPFLITQENFWISLALDVF